MNIQLHLYIGNDRGTYFIVFLKLILLYFSDIGHVAVHEPHW